MIDRDEFTAWLRLCDTPGVTRQPARALLAAFGSPDAVLGASTEARARVVPRPVAAALASPAETFEPRLAAGLAWLAQAGDAPHDVVPLGDSRYPSLLLETADPPLVLYVHGSAGKLPAMSLAIVGSRNPTAQGRETARAFAAHLSGSGWTIVSGLALGIDGAAHDGALDGAASTIAVVGTGLDRVYPARHRTLARRIVDEGGLIVSEFAIGTPALPPNFPIRNRIIAGLSRGTLVVEAALQSGSLVTARMASEAGREVFAIPGSIHSPQSKGCHWLIQQGAKLVEKADDIVGELGGGPSARPAGSRADGAAKADEPASTPAAEDPILAALGYDPIGLDALIARTGRSAEDLSARLLDLELAGRVARLPGQRFQRVERG